MIDIINRSNQGELIGLIKLGEESLYCMANVEYWIGTYWPIYTSSIEHKSEKTFFSFLKQFRIALCDLTLSYRKIVDKKDTFYLEACKPIIFIDFDQCHFVSFYHEEAIEDRVLEGWTSECKNVESLIPISHRYWVYNT